MITKSLRYVTPRSSFLKFCVTVLTVTSADVCCNIRNVKYKMKMFVTAVCFLFLLKLYLRQQGAKVSGNKTQLIERVLNMYADRTFETERHHEEDDEIISEETEENQEF